MFAFEEVLRGCYLVNKFFYYFKMPELGALGAGVMSVYLADVYAVPVTPKFLGEAARDCGPLTCECRLPGISTLLTYCYSMYVLKITNNACL